MEQKKQKGLLIVLSGPSGAGKGTVCAAVRNSEDVSIEYSISDTTRNPRNGEVDGREYFFYDKETFEQLREQGGFLEWAQVYDNYYGTPRQYVEEVLERGNDCILEIDPQGAFQVRAAWPEAILIFIAPPSLEELRSRLSGRGTESAEEMEKRLSCALEELGQRSKYDYVIVNDDVTAAANKLKAILVAEKCRSWRNCDDALSK